jgi:HK97 family phage major capsid protein
VKTIGDLLEERAQLIEKQRETLDTVEARDGRLSADERREYDRNDARIRALETEIRELEDDRSGGRNGPGREGEITRRRSTRRPTRSLDEDQEDAMRLVEKRSHQLDSAAGDRLQDLIERDRSGVDCRYLAAVADPAYRSAFAKRLARPDTAHQEFTPDEARAVTAVAEVMDERRSLSIGSDPAGGYAVPFELDPTIILTSDGQINPLRQIADVITVDSADEWRGITSEGVEAKFVKEATEAEDDSPELAQPVIRPERAQAFVPYSMEVAEDWDGLARELLRLFAEAKDALEAEKFLVGDGVDEPEGLLKGLAETSVVKTLAEDAVAADDVYLLQEALPARFQPRAQWLSALATANAIYRFSSPGGEEPPLFNEDRDKLLGKPWHEVSGMSSKLTTGGEKVLVYGDLRAGYKIVDRIGLTVEEVRHLFGANGRPTGQRGLYARWRVGAGVLVDNAVRVLEVK